MRPQGFWLAAVVPLESRRLVVVNRKQSTVPSELIRPVAREAPLALGFEKMCELGDQRRPAIE